MFATALAVTVDALSTSFHCRHKVRLEALVVYVHAYVCVVQGECGQLPEDPSAVGSDVEP
jgi:hypothetical protein